ncbi:MAG: hypothetical protein ACLPXZ_30620 [Mycobacterium sp.]
MEARNRLLGVEQQATTPGQFDLDMRAFGFGDRQAEQAVEAQRALKVARDDLDGSGDELVIQVSDVRDPHPRRLERIGHHYGIASGPSSSTASSTPARWHRGTSGNTARIADSGDPTRHRGYRDRFRDGDLAGLIEDTRSRRKGPASRNPAPATPLLLPPHGSAQAAPVSVRH